MAAQITVDREEMRRFELEKHRIDELHDIISPHLWQRFEQTVEETHAPREGELTAEVDISRIVFPEVSIRCHHHLMPQSSKTFCQGVVHIRIFAE